MRIIFQDIDGPLIPHRMYFHGGRWYDLVTKSFYFDPIAVGMINSLCHQCDAKVVFNSAHNVNSQEIMHHQAKCNSLLHMHEDCTTIFPNGADRLGGIHDWLDRHMGEVESWCVIDDMDVGTRKQVKVDYNIGMTIHNFAEAHLILTGKPWTPPLFISQADKIE